MVGYSALFCFGVLALLILVGVRGDLPFQDVSSRGAALSLRVPIASLNAWRHGALFRSELRYGDRGEDVRALQAFLNTNGYEVSRVGPGSPGNETRYFGPKTFAAVVSYQQDQEQVENHAIADSALMKQVEAFMESEMCPRADADYEYTDWMLAPVGQELGLPSGYYPDDLRLVSGEVYTSTYACLQADARDALYAMDQDMQEEGLRIRLDSAFRREEIQQSLFDRLVSLGRKHPEKSVALPGHSEHQLGTAIDVSGRSNGYRAVSESFAETQEYAWMVSHAHEYGFVLSYAKDTQDITGYKYEPWHWRYVGTAAATEIWESGQAPIEYLKIDWEGGE